MIKIDEERALTAFGTAVIAAFIATCLYPILYNPILATFVCAGMTRYILLREK